MAVVDFKVVALNANNQTPKGVRIVVWEGMDMGDTATAYPAPQFSGKAVQMDATGTASVTMQGTLVPEGALVSPVWGNLHTADLHTCTTTDSAIVQVLEDCSQIRPTVDTGTDVDIYLLVSTTARG